MGAGISRAFCDSGLLTAEGLIMAKYQHRVFRVSVRWDGGDYFLGAMIQQDENWRNVDELGEKGWEFVAFVPNPEAFIKGSFDADMLDVVRLAVFKREVAE
jgi:hypothetical protein